MSIAIITAFLSGFALGVVAVVLLWSRHADTKAEEAVHNEDAAYLRGWNRGISGKNPELKSLL